MGKLQISRGHNVYVCVFFAPERWSSHSMSSCDGVRPIVFEPVQFIPNQSPVPHTKAPANPLTQGTSPITGTMFRFSIFADRVIIVLGLRFALPERLWRHFLRAVAAAAFFVLVAAATSASCRGTSTTPDFEASSITSCCGRRVSLSLKDVAASQYVCSRGAGKLYSIPLRCSPCY